MDFHVLPGIDVSQGRLALFHDGERVFVGAFKGDPSAAAHAFHVAGAGWAHVVDMDLAFDGAAANVDVIRAVVASGLRVQASGGVATRAHVLEFLEAGAERVVLGSAALFDRNRTERLVAEFGERLVIGLEVVGERIVPRGAAARGIAPRGAAARGIAPFGLADTLGWLAGVPISRVLLTAVDRVGELSGPDLKALGTVQRAIDVPVLVAGGIATIEQVTLLRDARAAGVVLGRAAIEGAIELPAAFHLSTPPAEA